MPTQEWFEVRVMMAAEEARLAGFEHTYSALLNVLRASRCSDETMIGPLLAGAMVSSRHSKTMSHVCWKPDDFTKH